MVGDWLSLPALTGCISAGAAAAVSAPTGVYWNIPNGGKTRVSRGSNFATSANIDS